MGIWVAWRVAQLALVVVSGGSPVRSSLDWDGGWYRSIILDGYSLTDTSYATEQNVAFMPLLPYLTRPLAAVTSPELAMLTVANVLGLASFVAVYRAARCWLDETRARWMLVLFALWPFSLFLWAFYTEALFITLVAVGLVGLKERRHVFVCAAAFLLPMTRSIGVLFAAVAVVTVLAGRDDDRVRTAALYGGAGLAGQLLLVGSYHVAVGDGLAWLHVQAAWGRSFTHPFQPLITATQLVARRDPVGFVEAAVNGGAMVLGWTALGVVAVKRWWRNDHMAAPYLWAAVAFVVPQCTTLVSSTGRYMLAAFPLLLVAVHCGVSTRVREALAVAFAAGSMIVVAYYATGVFIG